MNYFDNFELTNPFCHFGFFDFNPENILKNDSFNLFSQENGGDNDISNIQIDLTNKNTQPTLNPNLSNENNIDNHDLYESQNMNMNLNENPIIENNPEDNKEKKKRGRKRKMTKEFGEHNRYSEDNIIRKIKSKFLNYLTIFINSLINEKYNGNIGQGKFIKEILKINQEQIINDKFNKILINKALKDIFSQNIIGKYSTFDSDHNKKLIELLLNEEDEKKKIEFQNLFNLTFMECLNHFSGIKSLPILKGMKLLKDLCKKFEDDQTYVNLLKYNTLNFEKIIMDKKSRNRSSKNIL